MSEKEHIEREAAFNALLKLVPKVDDDGYCWVIRGDAAKAIDSIPAADVRPVVRGKWQIYYTDLDNTYTRCTACLCSFKGAKNHYNFCPNCGADMREEA